MAEEKEVKPEVRGEGVSFLKIKPIEGDMSPEEAEELRKQNRPVYDKELNVYFVNGSKYRWAKSTLNLINGDFTPKKLSDQERKEHYTAQLAKNGVNPKSKTALAALYELRGGLIRNESQQKEADIRKVEMQKKAKRKMVE